MGPSKPPSDSNVSSFLRDAVNGDRISRNVLHKYAALSRDSKIVVKEAWKQISVQTPPRLLDEHTAWLVDVVHKADREWNTRQSCCFIANLFAGNGYSSALSAMPGGTALLEAQVSKQGQAATGTCTDPVGGNCVAITGWVFAPNGSGSWGVNGTHRSRYPSRDRLTFDIQPNT
jgi:hypothetical protein